MTRKLTDTEEELCRQAMLPVSTSAITGRRSFASSAALHESSHAVVIQHLGLKFNDILLIPTIEEDIVMAGSVQGFNFSFTDLNPDNVYVLLAPQAASDMFPFDSLGCGKDTEDAFNIGRYAYKLSTEGEFDSWFGEMAQHTQDRVEPLLKDIERVAFQLDCRRHLSYKNVKQILAAPSDQILFNFD